jgi:hypothetical protein
MTPLVWAAALVWGTVFAGRATGFDPNDGDLWWQRALGETVLRQHAIPTVLGPSSYTAPDAPWVAHEWLFSTAYAWCAGHHAVVVFQLALAACAAATMVLVASRATQIGGGRYAGIATVVCGAALAESFGVRAQVAAWPLLALFLVCFERRDAARWLVLPIVVLWANLHASVALAPVLACVGLFDTRWSARERLAMAVAVAGCTLCTPFGVALPAMTLHWSFDPDAKFIIEWGRPSLTDWPFLVGGLLPALALLADLRAQALSGRQRVTALIVVFAMFDHVRNVALAAIVIIPYACRVLETLTGPDRPRRWTRSDTGFMTLACLGAAIVILQAVRADKQPYPGRLAVAATERLAGAQRVYCEDFSWCSLFAGHPAVRVFLDGRTDAYPHTVFAAWDNVRHAAPGWERVLTDAGTTTILVRSLGVLEHAAKRSRHWRVAYADPRISVFVRSPAPR